MNLGKKIKEIWSADLARNSAKLLSANVLAQIIGLVVYPILTRLYSPDDFGLLSLFMQIGGILIIVSTADYHNAIVLPKEEKIARGTFHFGGILLLATTIFCCLCLPFSQQIATLFNAPSLAKFLWLLPIFVFCLGTWNLLNYWYIRQKEFGAIGRYQVSQNVLNAASKVGFGFGGFLRVGLIFSVVFIPIISLIISILTKFKVVKPLLIFDKKAICEAGKTYANFPKFSLPSTLINQVSNALPTLLLTPFFTLSEIGFFSMAVLLAFTPISTISRSIYQTFYQRTAVKVQNRQPILRFFRKFVCNTLLIVVPTFALLYFILPWLTELLLGEGWAASGELIRICLPWLVMVCIVSPIAFISDVFLQQKQALIYDTITITARLLALLIGITLSDFRMAVILYSIGGCIGLFIRFVWMMLLVRNYDKRIIRIN